MARKTEAEPVVTRCWSYVM